MAGSPREVLERTFGFAQFRPGQERVISTLLVNRSCLAIFPTGGGKSICYQLPALMLDGVTVVISPLIALMKDQIDFLVAHGVPAARLDSTIEAEVARRALSDLRAGRLKLLYVAPERFANERFLTTLQRLRISLLAIDEAHCISEWGHNFRPDYMKLARIAQSLNVPRVLALTATATPSVATDIARAFRIDRDDVVHTGFHRPNLFLRVTPCTSDQRDRILVDRVRSNPRGPAIIYVTLQKTSETVAAGLVAEGFPARAYHAGLDAELRHQIQEWFMTSSNAIVVATIAFGMGIDKRDIRYVYHYNLPKSLENYAQEIGRAGRDGMPSTCEQLPCMEDVPLLESFTYGDTPTDQAVAGLIEDVLARGPVFDVSPYELSFQHDVRPLVVETLLTYLELDDLIESTGPFYGEYKFQPLRSSAEILEKFDPTRVQFLRKLLAQAQPLKKWFRLELARCIEATGEPRDRIVAALNYLEEQGDIILGVTGVRQGYRRKAQTIEMDALKRSMVERFAHRERRDIERLQQVVQFSTSHSCYTRYLLDYFGEHLDEDCGHCAWCAGERPAPQPAITARRLEERDRRQIAAVIAEGNAALASPRQLTRFLCGISSPAASRAKLAKHPGFGLFSGIPFGDVLAEATVQMEPER